MLSSLVLDVRDDGLVLFDLMMQRHIERVDRRMLELAGRDLPLEQDVELRGVRAVHELQESRRGFGSPRQKSGRRALEVGKSGTRSTKSICTPGSAELHCSFCKAPELSGLTSLPRRNRRSCPSSMQSG